jgi:hypothetical protein
VPNRIVAAAMYAPKTRRHRSAKVDCTPALCSSGTVGTSSRMQSRTTINDISFQNVCSKNKLGEGWRGGGHREKLGASTLNYLDPDESLNVFHAKLY